MTKQDALAHFDNSPRKLAEALGITEQAIHQWGDTVPELRRYQIIEWLVENNYRAKIAG